MIFEFNQNVGGTLGAVRVYDAQGNEVDNLDVSHPQGQEHWMGVGLKPGLADGTYTATYRVISADTHIVYGGLVFNIGHAGAQPRFTVAGLIARNESGRVTKIAFGVVRALDYVSIALLVGGLAFVLFAWLPAFAATADGAQEWSAAAGRFAARMRGLLGAAIALGVLVSLLGVLLQGASAAGVSLWASLKDTILENTLNSRFGEVWGLRALDWLALAALLALAGTLRRRSRTAGAGLAAPPAWLLAPIAACALYLAATPALSGHASVQGPRGVFFPSDVLHVLSASVWVGGIACLLLALPAATRQLEGPQRSRLLLATLVRFSPLALGAVIAIALTGVVQAYIDVRTVHALLHSTYGALIIAKTLLLLALICLGWVNRERLIPALERIVGAARPPGSTGVLARRTLRGELGLMIAVFAVTAALISYAPPIDAASGPFSINTGLGPGGAGDDRGTGARRAQHRSPVPDQRPRRHPVHRHQGIHGHRPAALQGDRPAAPEGQPRGAGALHPQLRRAQPRRRLADRTDRPRLRIPAVQPHDRGPRRMRRPKPRRRRRGCPSTAHKPSPGGTRQMRSARIAPLAAVAALLAPATAAAHISLHPNTIPAGAFATLDVRVPGEQEGAYVKKVDVLFPTGFTGVDYENVPGWKTTLIEAKLATPISEDGETIDTEVSQIVWTWTGPLGKVENGQFINFPLSLAIPANAAGRGLEFRTVQTYSNGQVVHWIDPSLSAEHPSPRINVTAKGGVIEDVAGAEAGPAAGQTGAAQATPASAVPPSRPAGATASKGLGVTALILGALGLLVGSLALASSRRRGAA